MKEFTIDKSRIGSMIWVKLQNKTLQNQNFNHNGRQLSLAPRAADLVRIDRVHYNGIRSLYRETFEVTVYNELKSVRIVNGKDFMVQITLEDGRPIRLKPEEEILVHEVVSKQFYVRQSVKVFILNRDAADKKAADPSPVEPIPEPEPTPELDVVDGNEGDLDFGDEENEDPPVEKSTDPADGEVPPEDVEPRKKTAPQKKSGKKKK